MDKVIGDSHDLAGVASTNYIDLGKVFDLLITARNSKDEEALQEAIDIVAIAACRTDDF